MGEDLLAKQRLDTAGAPRIDPAKGSETLRPSALRGVWDLSTFAYLF